MQLENLTNVLTVGGVTSSAAPSRSTRRDATTTSITWDCKTAFTQVGDLGLIKPCSFLSFVSIQIQSDPFLHCNQLYMWWQFLTLFLWNRFLALSHTTFFFYKLFCQPLDLLWSEAKVCWCSVQFTCQKLLPCVSAHAQYLTGSRRPHHFYSLYIFVPCISNVTKHMRNLKNKYLFTRWKQYKLTIEK